MKYKGFVLRRKLIITVIYNTRSFGRNILRNSCLVRYKQITTQLDNLCAATCIRKLFENDVAKLSKVPIHKAILPLTFNRFIKVLPKRTLLKYSGN